MSEYNEQVTVIAWRNELIKKGISNAFPGIEWLHASLNGIRLTPGLARKAKAQGMTSGIADLFLPVKNLRYSGLYIEMKFGKNKQSAEQKTFQSFVESKGYKYELCYSAEEAIKQIMIYYKDVLNGRQSS